MKNTKRLIALILTVATMICTVSCAGSVETPGSDTSSLQADNGSENEKTNDSNDKTNEPSCADIFDAAADKLRSVSELKQDIEVKAQKKIGTFEYSEQIESVVQLSGAGTDELVAEISERVILDDSVINTKETYKKGEATFEFDGDDIYYSTSMTAKDFSDRIIPAVILDSALYSNVSFDEKDENVINFKDATELESWISNGRARLVSAQGSAKLDSDGNIESMRYVAAYVQGPLCATVEVNVSIGTSSLDKESVGRNDTKNKKVISDIDVPYAVRYASEVVEMDPVGSVTSEETIISMAAGAASVMNYNFASYGKGNEYIAIVEAVGSVEGPNGQINSIDWEEKFIDGKASLSENGGNFTDTTNTKSDFESFAYSIVMSNVIDPIDYSFVNVSVVGDYVSFNYTLDEDFGRIIEDDVNYRVFGDKDALDKLASAYNTKKLEGYITLDMDTMLIVAAGIDFECEHTIEGVQYLLGYYSSQIVEIGDLSAYETVKGEPLPDTEPEKEATPVFYEVTSPNGKKMYLLGTIHIGDEKTAYLPCEIYDALDSSDALAVEIDVSKMQEWIEGDEKLMQDYINSIIYTDGTKIYDKIPSELHEQYKNAIRLVGGMSYADYFVPSVIAMQYEREVCDRINGLMFEKGVDERLLAIANKEGKEVLSIESIYDRFDMNKKYSDKTQALLLEASLRSTRAAYESEMNELYSMWIEGDENRIREYLKNENTPKDMTEEELAAYEEYNRVMMTERDEKMLKKAKEYLESDKTVFFAVGLAHVLGETGLVDALRAEGYTVTLVEYE